ncbi:MAG: hypothetical protein WD830_09915 [Chloroflexota bacterium]
MRARIALLSIVVAGCTTATQPPIPTSPAGASPAASVPMPNVPGPSAGPSDVPGSPDPSALIPMTLGPEAAPFVSHMVIFADGEPGPDTPAPLNAEVDVDTGAARTTVVPGSGGVISATDAAGTVYTLEIPATALLMETEITMTPIASVASTDERGFDAPWDRPLGVQLEPVGLHLFDVATLGVDAPGVSDAWVAVATGPGGAEAHLYPTVEGAAALTLPITHFSDFIVVDGIFLPTAVPPSIPTGAQGQLERDIATAQEGGITDTEIEGIRDKYWPYVESVLSRAAGDCAFAEGGQLARAMSLVRTLDATGFTHETDVPMAQDGVLRAIENCIREMTEERCFDRRASAHVLRLLALARQAEIAGSGDAYARAVDLIQGAVAPNEACGDLYGTLVLSQRSTQAPWTESDLIILDIRMRGTNPIWTDAGSSFVWTINASSDCGTSSTYGAGQLYWEGTTSGTGGVLPPYPVLQVLPGEEALLVAPVRGETSTILCSGPSPVDNDEHVPGCPVDGDTGLRGRIQGDLINFTCTDLVGETHVTGSLTIAP